MALLVLLSSTSFTIESHYCGDILVDASFLGTAKTCLFVVALVQSYIYLFESNEAKIKSFKDYSPPPLIRDVQVLDQTFLI